MPRLLTLLLALTAFLAPAARAQDDPPPPAGSFKIFFDPTLQSTPYTGRVYIALAKGGRGEPRQQMGDWFGGSQTLALDVKDLAPGGSVIVGADALAFPKPYAEISEGEYTVQAVARRSLDSANPGKGEGDLYSKPLKAVSYTHLTLPTNREV